MVGVGISLFISAKDTEFNRPVGIVLLVNAVPVVGSVIVVESSVKMP